MQFLDVFVAGYNLNLKYSVETKTHKIICEKFVSLSYR